MAISQKISKQVSNQFPAFYKEEAPLFLEFMEAYYEYMEQNGKMSDAIRNLESYRDISTTTEDFIGYFIHSFLPSVPKDVLADKKLMVKYINQYNQARGTLASYKLLFRALYNEDVAVQYPSEQILKVSDGDWRKERYLVVRYEPATYRFVGKTILGVSSGAQALVEDIVRRKIKGKDFLQLILSNIAGTFSNKEPIKLINDNSSTPHSPIIEAGIDGVTIISPGAEYRVGDVVELLSDKVGAFAKVVVTAVQDLGGTITFELKDGGSGYTASTQENGTEISIVGGDGTEPASFRIEENDIVDKFALAMCTTFISSNSIYGLNAPTVAYANGATLPMSNFANVSLSAANFGFREDGENIGNQNYYDQWDAKLVIANTSNPGAVVEDSLYGVTSSANATVVGITRGYNSTDVVYHTKGYKKFQVGEKVNLGTSTGTTIGIVSDYYANTIGAHTLQIRWEADTATSPLLEGTELRGANSGAFGVVKRIESLTPDGYTGNTGIDDDRDLYQVLIGANNSANLSNQFDSGPMNFFHSNEGLYEVGTGTFVGNAIFTTANTDCENIYTKIKDAILFETTTFGTVSKISLPVGGSGFSVAPKVTIRENNISSLGIGEQYITLQSDDVNWGTGEPSITKLDTNDKINGVLTAATGHIKGGDGPNKPVVVTAYANGTYEMTVRVWQDFQQRTPGNIYYANNDICELAFYSEAYVQGLGDNRGDPTYTGSAKIVNIKDEGVLGENAVIDASVGANGTITGLRVLDSGFSYIDGEKVTLATPKHELGLSATVDVSLGGVANSEGYYATSRSQISTLRGYIQDSDYYQEYSYEIESALTLDRYRDYALELAHPAGQKMFGSYKTASNVAITVTANSSFQTQSSIDGRVTINKNAKTLNGTGTNFQDVVSPGDYVIIEATHKNFYKIPINTVSSQIKLTLTIPWTEDSITGAGANAYYITGSI